MTETSKETVLISDDVIKNKIYYIYKKPKGYAGF